MDNSMTDHLLDVVEAWVEEELARTRSLLAWLEADDGTEWDEAAA